MFALLMMFCIALITSTMILRIGIISPCASPVVNALIGVILGAAYSGVFLPGMAIGLMAAAVYANMRFPADNTQKQ